jgi:hypothetical protein
VLRLVLVLTNLQLLLLLVQFNKLTNLVATWASLLLVLELALTPTPNNTICLLIFNLKLHLFSFSERTSQTTQFLRHLTDLYGTVANNSFKLRAI